MVDLTERTSGILLPVSALPGGCGIGQLGGQAYAFVDFLAAAGQKYWQVLPLVPTGYGDSPYQSCCSYAGSEYLISLETLKEKGLITARELAARRTPPSSRVDYGALFVSAFKLLRKAFSRFNKNDMGFKAFVLNGEYADYALYRCVKAHFGHTAYTKWPQEYKSADKKTLENFKRGHVEELLFWQWCQYEFFLQWAALKSYAGKKGIKIIGDMPIYLAHDSVECWLHPELVQLDENLNPVIVAGCPPDYFSADGQLWGNPIYDWDRIKADGYKWWIDRLRKCFELFDVVRIDHFRGFDRYFAIPGGAVSAKEGEWRSGPSSGIFTEIEKITGKMPVIAEDLGILDDSAREMFAAVGYPGMKVLQYAFDDPSNDYLPHNYKTDNCVVYPGTHDNDTLCGFIAAMKDEEREAFRRAVLDECARCGLDIGIENESGLAAAIIRLGFESKAALVITQMQDFLGVGGEGRINEPSTLSPENWSYRIPEDYASGGLAERIKNLTERSGRI